MASPGRPLSKGMQLIAAYRAERLSQRLLLRETLRQSHTALHNSRDIGKAPGSAAAAGDALETVTSPPRMKETQSVFADMVNDAAALRRCGEALHPADAPLDEIKGASPAAGGCNDVDTAAKMSSRSEVEAQTADPAGHSQEPQPGGGSYDPPLAEIGFGPGMLLRLNQLGLKTRGDLAQADAEQLRASLGEISRLIDVETWINGARCPPGTD